MNERSFTELVAPHRTHLERLGLRLARNRDDAQDLVQETMLRAYAHRESFTEGTNARAWLGRILRNLFVDRQRKRVADARLEVVVAAQMERRETLDPSELVEQSRVIRTVRSALRDLPEPFRSAVERVDLEEHDYATTASLEGCPEGTIMSRVHRGRRRLAAALERSAFGPAWVAA